MEKDIFMRCNMDFLSDIRRFHSSHKFNELLVGKFKFRYILCGKGKKTVTLLTGGMGLAELNFKFIEKLETKYRVLAFDYPMEIDNNAKLAKEICALIRKLGIEKTILIGESYGGYLAQIIARNYPDLTEGMCLFSTAGLNTDTIVSLRKKYSKIAKPMLWVLGHAPYEWLKPLLIKSSLKHLKNVSDEEYKYMKDFFTWAFKDYQQDFDVHMTSLLIGIMNQSPCQKEEFAYLKDKVMLILPDDDDTFTPDMQRALISLFDAPYVVEHISGGHLAPIMQAEKYSAKIVDFMRERITG